MPQEELSSTGYTGPYYIFSSNDLRNSIGTYKYMDFDGSTASAVALVSKATHRMRTFVHW